MERYKTGVLIFLIWVLIIVLVLLVTEKKPPRVIITCRSEAEIIDYNAVAQKAHQSELDDLQTKFDIMLGLKK